MQDAAVVGPTFSAGAVAALGDHGPEAVRAMVEELVRRELVRPSPPMSAADEQELSFWHTLVRDVAYASLTRSDRLAKHLGAATWLEEHPGGDLVGAAAPHYVRVSELAAELGRDEELRALEGPMMSAFVRAGERARRTFVADVAAGWFDRTIPLAERAGRDDVIVPARLARGAAREQMGSFAEAQEDYEGARDAAVRSGFVEGEGRALAALSHVLWLRDRYEEGDAALAQALEHARSAGANDLLARLLYTAGTLAFGRGRFGEALEHHEEAVRVARMHDDPLGEAMALHGLCETRFFVGPFSRSLADGLEADHAFRTLGDRPMVFHNLYMVALAHWLRGELTASLTAFDESIEGSRELGNRRDEGFAMSRGLAHLLLGNLGAAVADPTRAVELAASLRTPRMDLTQRAVRLHAWAELGAVDRLREDLAVCKELAASLGGSFYRPRWFAWEGWLALQAQDRAGAADRFQEGMQMAAGVELDLVWNSWIELLAAEEHGTPDDLRRAGDRLGEICDDDALGLADWAAYGRALADARSGSPEAIVLEASRLVQVTSSRCDLMLRWRASLLEASAAAAAGRLTASAAARARAAEDVRAIAETTHDDSARKSYLARPLVAAALEEPEDAWFRDLDAMRLADLARHGVELSTDGGPIVVGDAVWGVDAGGVRLVEGDLEIARIGPGGLLCEERLAGERSGWLVVADRSTRLIGWGPETLTAILASSPRTLDRVIAGLAARLEAMPAGAGSSAAVVRTIEHLAQRGRSDGVLELFPVLLRGAELRWLRPAGTDRPLRIAGSPDRHPSAVVEEALRSRGLSPVAVHSTSWRSDGERVVLTYLAVVHDGGEAWQEEGVAHADLARGSARGAPSRIDRAQVLEHALRHLSWLSKDDPVIQDLLRPDWTRALSAYTPEPFRSLGGT